MKKTAKARWETLLECALQAEGQIRDAISLTQRTQERFQKSGEFHTYSSHKKSRLGLPRGGF
ncbi:hypothetical protein [Polaromonas sp. SP1]|uniref:hypothetical protein n=1 Tax=Polaromonas sp. SP1 TaxID=2268087 RepID=UPI00129D9454|nr:hypothetical protein [Polaromonas sp. SP1]QGJ20547.1 hypothetical protein F7R28_20555 [Polaromonas sp. Pch-P]